MSDEVSAIAAPRNEGEFTRQVLKMATDMDLLTHFCADARKCAGRRGFPDLVVAGKYGVLFAELKFDGNDTTPEQDLWLWTLDAATGRSAVLNVAIWRPADLESGEVERVLRDLRYGDEPNRNKSPRRNNVRQRIRAVTS